MNEREEIKQLGVGLAKAAVGAIPVAGGLLNQLIFDVRGSLKQARYNRFIDALSDYMNDHFRIPLSIHQIEQEQIGDFFESVVNRVVRISAQKKIDALKRLLASKIVEPKEFDYAEVLAELLAGMSDYETIILQKIVEDGGKYADHYSDFAKHRDELDRLKSLQNDRQAGVFDPEDSVYEVQDRLLEDQVNQQKEKIAIAEMRLKEVSAPFDPKTYGLERWEYHLHLTQLFRKGIIGDDSGRFGAEALTVVLPNQVAYDLMDFLVEV